MLFVLGIMIVGFVSLLFERRRIVGDINIVEAFTCKFVTVANKYFESRELVDADYQALLKKVDKVQRLLGQAGTVQYKPPGASFMHNNYQLLINILPEFASRKVHGDSIRLAESMLRRWIGNHEDLLDLNLAQMKNPLQWFVCGITAVLSVPVRLLSGIGIISNQLEGGILGSWFFRVLSGIVSLVSVLDTIAAIVTGKSFTVEFIQHLLSRVY